MATSGDGANGCGVQCLQYSAAAAGRNTTMPGDNAGRRAGEAPVADRGCVHPEDRAAGV
jgi:hypothetical protein